MLRFLNTLFRPAPTSELDAAMLEEAIERAVDGTDPRLRLIPGYRKRLLPAVSHAVEHVVALIDALPTATELSPQVYTDMPPLRAFFASPARVGEMLSGSETVREFINGRAGSLSDEIFGLLSMDWQERKVLGSRLHGDQVQREVAQVQVSFSEHRFICPSATEAELRIALERRAFDFLVEQALKQLLASQDKRADLKRQRSVLKRKLRSMQAGDWGFENILGEEQSRLQAKSDLETDIEQLDTELNQLGGDTAVLDASLDSVAATLSEPEKWLATRDIALRLDQMGIKVDAASAARADDLELTELHSADGARRIVFMARVPKKSVPEPVDHVSEAERYLF